MAWSINERPNSRKFLVSDDGTARATVSLVLDADYNDLVVASAPDSVWDALLTDFQIGTIPNLPSDPFQEQWRVESYSGVQAANSEGNVWTVEVGLSFAGPMDQVQPISSSDPFFYRRDIEVMTGSVVRQASTYVDWYAGTANLPTDGDADWSASSLGYLQISGAQRSDVNGRPIIMRLPGTRITINHIHQLDIEGAIYMAKEYVGTRNDETILDWEKGKLLFESVETVQLGHGFQRNTYRFYGDQFYHLEQEPAVTPMDNGSIFRDATTTISSDIVVSHVEAVWRQPYALTTDRSFVLADIFPRAVDQTYIQALT